MEGASNEAECALEQVANVQIEARRAFAPSLSNAGLDTGKDDAP